MNKKSDQKTAKTAIYKRILILPAILIIIALIATVIDLASQSSAEYIYQGQGVLQYKDDVLQVVCAESPKYTGMDENMSFFAETHFTHLVNTKNFKVPFLLRKKAKELLGRADTAEVTITICVREQRMPSALYKSDGACYKIAWEIQDIAAIEVK